MSAEIKNYLDKFYYEAPYVVFDASFYEVFVVPNKEDAIKKLEKIAGDGAILCLTKCVAKALKMKTSYCVPVHFPEKLEEIQVQVEKREMASNRKMPTKREWLKRRLTPGDGDGYMAVSSAKKWLRNKTLFVSNLQFSIKEDDVFEFFEVAGQIVKVEYAIISEKFAGYVLIHFATHDAARKALELSGHKMLSRVIRIEAPEDKVACRDGMKDSGGAWVCSAVFKAYDVSSTRMAMAFDYIHHEEKTLPMYKMTLMSGGTTGRHGRNSLETNSSAITSPA
ncbi:nucleotide-binding alpha-beta plait domain-containing protein [Tanacetum coccineum]